MAADSTRKTLPNHPIDIDQSPNAMAEAAYAAAVVKMEREMAKRNRNHRNDISDDNSTRSREDENSLSRPTKVFKSHGEGVLSNGHPNNNDIERENAAVKCIKEVWNSSDDAEVSLAETLRVMIDELDSFVQCGLGAFYHLDATSRQLAQSKELAETRSRETQRLQANDEQSRASLSVGDSPCIDKGLFCAVSKCSVWK